ncbi:MAG: uroporphyrinogen-III C-methyltransferase [Chloroflexi bacterium]|nr:uroporphyrinogen-III C-methyltransferase [Chloroflexota bacterium]
MADSRLGRVFLVGGGPGDPGLLTVRGKECLEQADVVIYDRLIDPSLLRLAPPEAECIFAGKESDHRLLDQEEINQILVSRAREGKRVVRLKGGDPFVLGRGGEEAEALAAAGIPFEVVPGVTSAIAVPAYAGIPVTHRDLASAFTVVTGHEDPGKLQTLVDWERLGRSRDTIIILMGLGNLGQIAEQLIRHGRPPTTPVAVIERGTTPAQRTVVGVLADIETRVRLARLRPPAVIVIGEIVRLRERLAWYDRRPLFGKRVLITRTREQASVLAALLAERGAIPIELPTIRTLPPDDWGPCDRAIAALDQYDWIIFTSVNGVRFFFQRLEERGLDVRALKGIRLAAIGPATAGALAAYRLRVDFCPSEYIAEAIVEGMGQFDLRGRRILLPRAREAREVLAEGLAARGALVDEVAVYQTGPASTPEEALALFENGGIDIATFTSSSTVRNLVALLGDRARPLLSSVLVACIGPITARTARDLGLTVQIEAQEHSIPGLVAAIEQALADRQGEQEDGALSRS